MQRDKGIWDYYEQLYSKNNNNNNNNNDKNKKIDSQEEMDRFLEKFSLPRLNQEETEITNSPVTTTEIEAVIKNLIQHKSPVPDGFT